MAAVQLNREFAEFEAGGNLFVRSTGDDLTHDYLLTRRQQGKSSLDIRKNSNGLPTRLIAVDAEVNGVNQFLVTKWFGQELNCTGFNRSDGHRNIPMPGNKNDGKIDAQFRQFMLEIKSVHPWESDVKDDTSRHIWQRKFKKLIGGAEGLHIELNRTNKTIERFTDGSVVVDNEHKWRALDHDATAGPSSSRYHLRAFWQEKLKDRTMWRVGCCPYAASVGFDN